MSRWSERRDYLGLRLAAVALCLGLVFFSATGAHAAPAKPAGKNARALSPGKKGPAIQGVAGPQGPKGAKKGNKESGPGSVVVPIEGGQGPTVKEVGESGQIDPISGLGLRNPVCDKPSEIRSTQTRLSCEMNGSPEGTYSTTNYGFDVHIETGLTHPVGSAQSFFVGTVLNGIWLGLIGILKLVLALLGLAFNLNPFAEGGSMRDISRALDRLYRAITDPWLSVTIAAGGIWFAYRGLVRRDLAASVGGTLAGVAMLIVGLWIIHQPAASVGRLAKISDQAAVTIITAPRSGSLARPTGTYAEAMSSAWAQLVEVPFAGLNFSDVKWAMGPPPPEAVKRADEKLCEDVGALVLVAILSGRTSPDTSSAEGALKACEQFARKRFGRPQRVIDLYLRSSPGSPSRDALWDYFDDDEGDRYKAKVAAQGGDGVMTRLSMLALFALGMLGAVMLLAWLAIRLFTQAAIAFVLLLAAPFAVFFPMLGDSGRRAFKTWGLTLLGATVAKVIYAAFLSVVLLGMEILGRVGDATGFLLASAFAWAVFLKRTELIAWMSIGDAEGGRQVSPLAQFLAFSGARRVAKAATGTVGGVGSRFGRVARQRVSDGKDATRDTAQSSLDKGARGLADIRHKEAKGTVARYEAKYGGSPAGDGGKKGKRSAGSEAPGASRQSSQQSAAKGGGGGGGATPSAGETKRYERAKELVDQARGNEEKTGDPWTHKDLQKFGAESRELASSGEILDNTHRAKLSRSEFEELPGGRREEAEREIKDAMKRDQKRGKVSDEAGWPVVKGGQRAAERLRQLKERPWHPDRSEALGSMRKERSELARRNRRLGISRRRS